MFRLGIVGDLSQENPANLARALDAALAVSDMVVQVGDINPGYSEFKARLAGGKLLAIPGNHDTQGPGNWDASLPGLAKQWRHDAPGGAAVLIGLDNSADRIDQAGWDLLAGYSAPVPRVPVFVFIHKPLSTIILPDGTESGHIMGEGSLPCADAEKLKGWCAVRPEVAVVCGHYHGSATMRTDYATVLLEGRGGAGGLVGFTVVYIDGPQWTAHAVAI